MKLNKFNAHYKQNGKEFKNKLNKIQEKVSTLHGNLSLNNVMIRNNKKSIKSC